MTRVCHVRTARADQLLTATQACSMNRGAPAHRYSGRMKIQDAPTPHLMRICQDDNELASLPLLGLTTLEQAYEAFPAMPRRNVRRLWAGRARLVQRWDRMQGVVADGSGAGGRHD